MAAHAMYIVCSFHDAFAYRRMRMDAVSQLIYCETILDGNGHFTDHFCGICCCDMAANDFFCLCVNYHFYKSVGAVDGKASSVA